MLIISDPQSSPLCGPSLAHAPAGSAFRNAELLLNVIDELAAALRA
jgi:hypothetical protein